MLATELINKIHELYKRSHISMYPHDRIFRGEGRSVSSEMEDLFAKYLIEELPDDITLFINQTITSGSKSKRIRVKPDVMVVRNNEIKTLIDLKMDLGYKRSEFSSFWDERDSLMPKMYGKEFSYYKPSIDGKEKIISKLSSNAKLFFMVVSNLNIDDHNLNDVVSRISKKRYSNLYFLFEGIHPNDYKSNIIQLLNQKDKVAKNLSSLLDELRISL
jgi:hypothetical protein